MLFCEIELYTHLINPPPAISRWGILFVRFPVSWGNAYIYSTLEIPVLILTIECGNLLSIGTPISTQRADLYHGPERVPIPYLSGHPFLLTFQKSMSTGYDVSIPYLSGHPFLQETYLSNGKIIYLLCQSPIYRDTHFYQDELAGTENRINVSIPYLSGHPFLHTTFLAASELCISECQSPIYRDTHFYPHPQNCLILCGLPASILQVFIRQF